jgi:hypothetical protein
LAVSALPSVVGPGESTSLTNFDPTACASVVTVVSNQSQTAPNPTVCTARSYLLSTEVGSPNTPPTISGLPDQTLAVNTSRDNAIDLWAYADDAESTDAELSFNIDNSPDPGAGVTLDSDRYIDINPTTDWIGQTAVTVRVTDTLGLSDTDTFQVTVQASADHSAFLPSIVKSYPPWEPTPGFWRSTTEEDEFYVTPDSAFVDDYAIYVFVPDCGDLKITHNQPEPIVNYQFSFSGDFYASGTFSSETTAGGTSGLSSYFIPQCSIFVSGGPWPWDANWQSGSQPRRSAEVVRIETSKPRPVP